MILGFIFTPLFVRKMGTEVYGIWILVFTIIGYLRIVVSGLPGGVVKHIAEAKGEGDQHKQVQVINCALVAYLFIGAVIGVSIYFLATPLLTLFNISPKNFVTTVNLLKIGSIFIILSWPFFVFPAVLQGLLKNTVLNSINGLTSILNWGMLLFAVYNGYSLEIMLIMSYTISLASFLILALLVKKQIPALKFSIKSFDFSVFRSLTSFTIQMLLLEVIGTLAFETDNFILAYLLPVSAVGFYAITTKLFYELRNIYGLLLTVVTPLIFEAHKINDRSFIEKMVIKGTKYVNMSFVPLVILAMIISKPFITLWMGNDFGKYGYWSAFYLSQYLFSPVVGVIGTVAIGMSRLRPQQIVGIAMVVFNVVVSVIMVKLIGFPGVLVGTVADTLVAVPIIYHFNCKSTQIPWKEPLRHNWKISSILIFVFLIPGFFIMEFIPATWVAIIIFSAVFIVLVYGVMYLFFIEDEEKLRLRKFVSSTLRIAL